MFSLEAFLCGRGDNGRQMVGVEAGGKCYEAVSHGGSAKLEEVCKRDGERAGVRGSHSWNSPLASLGEKTRPSEGLVGTLGWGTDTPRRGKSRWEGQRQEVWRAAEGGPRSWAQLSAQEQTSGERRSGWVVHSLIDHRRRKRPEDGCTRRGILHALRNTALGDTGYRQPSTVTTLS